MKRTILAVFLAEAIAGAAWAGTPETPPPPPAHPAHVAPPAPPAHAVPPVPPSPPTELPPLPPLPPMQHGQSTSATATLDLKGPVTVRANVISAGVEVVGVGGKQLRAQLVDSSGGVRLVESGNRVDVMFDARSGWPHIPGGIDGRLRLELPRGSNVELTSASGDVVVKDLAGDVRLRSASGEVQLHNVRNVEVMAVSGDVVVDNASGEVRLRTVSGDARVTQGAGAANKLEFGTTSGDLLWAGVCGSGCRIETRSMSGDVKLQLLPSSSFDLRWVTHSGDVSDDLKMQTLESSSAQHGGSCSLHARYGKGEGVIESQSFSGDLHVAKK